MRQQFYGKDGLEKLKECASTRNPKVPPSVVRGFEKIDAGDSKTGSLLILQHEQHDVLQPLVFDRQDISTMMTANQAALVIRLQGGRYLRLLRKEIRRFSIA